jgi:predicted dehydrogenase
MDVSLAACDRLIAEADRARTLCGVISQHRFDAASLLAKQLLDNGDIGRIVLATADVKWYRTQAYYDEGDWRGTWKLDGGGALINQGIHTVDLLQWLAGGVSSVHARASIAAAHERIEVEDAAVLSLEFNNGAIGSLVATTAAFDGFPVRIEIFGTEGSILLEGDNLKRIVLKTGQTFDTQEAAEHAVKMAQGGTASQTVINRPSAPAGAAWGDAHRAQIEDFVRAIRHGGKPMIDVHAGLEPVAIAVAAYESARSGKTIHVARAPRP